jgi:hypothetical protein
MSNLYNALYVDYDGVLVNWMGGVIDSLGKEYAEDSYNGDKLLQQERGDKLAALGSEWWANLKPMDDYEHLWSYLVKFDPHILTAYPSWHDVCAENSKIGKPLWNDKYTKVATHKFHVVKRDNKQLYAKTGHFKNVLIDDYKKNIKQWEAAGGVGIYHKSATQTIERLMELGYT